MTFACRASARVLWVDALRGYAVLGLLLVHQSEFFELYWLDPQPGPIQQGVFALFSGKAFALLALCFGFSFHVQSQSAARAGEAFAPRFAWRMILLAVIGTLHGILYRGDIIVVLALMGMLFVPVGRLGNVRWLTAIAVACFLQPLLLIRIAAGLAGAEWGSSPPGFFDDPGLRDHLQGSLWVTLSANAGPGQLSKWSYYIETGRCFQILGLFILGSVFSQRGVFERAEASAQNAAFWAGLSALSLAALSMLEARLPQTMGPQFYSAMLVGGWVDLAGTALSFWLIVMLWNSGLRPLIACMVPAGRMSLTLYLSQSLVLVPFFYPFGAGAHSWIGQGPSIALGVALFAAQIVFARWWFAYYRYGPVEWLWRAATRLDARFPNRLAGTTVQ